MLWALLWGVLASLAERSEKEPLKKDDSSRHRRVLWYTVNFFKGHSVGMHEKVNKQETQLWRVETVLNLRQRDRV